MELTLALIGGKWKPLVLWYLATQGIKRFSEIRKFLRKVTHRTLTSQLRQLEEDGLIFRKTYPVVPPKVEYGLTKKGKTLEPLLFHMCQWARENVKESYEVIKPLCGSNSAKKKCCKKKI